MSDKKLLIGMLVVFGALAAGWWFGWFAPITKQFQQMKKNVVVTR